MSKKRLFENDLKKVIFLEMLICTALWTKIGVYGQISVFQNDIRHVLYPEILIITAIWTIFSK